MELSYKTSQMRCSLRRIILCCGGLTMCILACCYLLSGINKLDMNDIEDHEDDVRLLSHDRNCILISGKCYHYEKKSGRVSGLNTTVDSFTLNGNKFRIISGSFHYFRTHPRQWADRLRRMKAAGLNTVMTYIPWNLHEKVRGVVDVSRAFDSSWSLISFIELVQTFEMYLIIRPGPYICAEWELGGLPSWLLHDPNMVVRSSDYAPYLDHVSAYYGKLLPQIADYTYMRGGPIIAFQVENEFGSYSIDREYLSYLVELFQNHKLDELFFTSDGPKQLNNGTLPGILATINFQKNASNAIAKLRAFQPLRPVLVTEFWSGWFDHWTNKHHRFDVEDFTETVDEILSLNASINFYMFVGGTNFGLYNGANFITKGDDLGYHATVTSYDYDALVGEAGDCHPTKYEALRSLLVKHGIVDKSALPPIPASPRHVAYNDAVVEEFMSMDLLSSLVTNKPVTHPETIEMEFLNINNNGGQSFGWILYRTVLSEVSKFSTITIKGSLKSRGLVLVNGKLVSTIYKIDEGDVDIKITLSDITINGDGGTNILELLVENMGRVNYIQLNDQRMGFRGHIDLDGTILNNWEHISLEFDELFITSLIRSSQWKKFIKIDNSYPAVYRASFKVSLTKPCDTFLDMDGWDKGVVLLNGFNLGRYWRVGPQRTLYVPAPLLRKGWNDLVVFELGIPSSTVKFSANPILDAKW